MNPLKIFLNSITRSAWTHAVSRAEQQDPFDHPDIRAMDPRQLADLPMPYLPAATVVDADAERQQEGMPLARCA